MRFQYTISPRPCATVFEKAQKVRNDAGGIRWRSRKHRSSYPHLAAKATGYEVPGAPT